MMQRWTKIFLRKHIAPSGYESLPTSPHALLLSLFRRADVTGKDKRPPFTGDSNRAYSEEFGAEFGRTVETSMSDTTPADSLPRNDIKDIQEPSLLSSSVGCTEEKIPEGLNRDPETISSTHKTLHSEMRRLEIDEQAVKRVVDKEMLDATELKLLNLTGSCLLVTTGGSDGSDWRIPSSEKQRIWKIVPRFDSLRAIKNSVRSHSNLNGRFQMQTEGRSEENLFDLFRVSSRPFSLAADEGLTSSILENNQPNATDISPLDFVAPPNTSRKSAEISGRKDSVLMQEKPIPVQRIDDSKLVDLDLTDFFADDVFTVPEMYKGSLQAAVQDIANSKHPNSIKYVGVHQDLGHLIIGQNDKILGIVPKRDDSDTTSSECTPTDIIDSTIHENLLLGYSAKSKVIPYTDYRKTFLENKYDNIPLCGGFGALALNMLVDVSKQPGSTKGTSVGIENQTKTVDKGSTSSTGLSAVAQDMFTVPVVRFGSGDLGDGDEPAGQKDPSIEAGGKNKDSRKGASGKSSPGWAAGLKSGLQTNRPPLNVGTTCESPKHMSENPAPLGQSVILSHSNRLEESGANGSIGGSGEPSQQDGYPQVPILCYPAGNRVRRTKSGRIKFPRPCPVPIASQQPSGSAVLPALEGTAGYSMEGLSPSEPPYSPSPPNPPSCENLGSAPLVHDSSNGIRCCPWPAHLPCPCMPKESTQRSLREEIFAEPQINDTLVDKTEIDEPPIIDNNIEDDRQDAVSERRRCACMWPCGYPCPDWNNLNRIASPQPIPLPEMGQSQQLLEMDDITGTPMGPLVRAAYEPTYHPTSTYPESAASDAYLRTPSLHSAESAETVSFQSAPSYQSVPMSESPESYQSIPPSYRSVTMYEPLRTYQSVPSYQSVAMDEQTGYQSVPSYRTTTMYEPTGSYRTLPSYQSVVMDESAGSYQTVPSYQSVVMDESAGSYQTVPSYQSIVESCQPSDAYQSVPSYQPMQTSRAPTYQSAVTYQPLPSYQSVVTQSAGSYRPPLLYKSAQMPSSQSAGNNQGMPPLATLRASQQSGVSSCMPWVPCPNWVPNPYPVVPKSQKNSYLSGSMVMPIMEGGLVDGGREKENTEQVNKSEAKQEGPSRTMTTVPEETKGESSRSNELQIIPSEKPLVPKFYPQKFRNVSAGMISSDPEEKGPVVGKYFPQLGSSSLGKASSGASQCNITQSLHELLPETRVNQSQECDSVSCSQPASLLEHRPVVRIPNGKFVKGTSLYNFRSIEAEMRKLSNQAIPGIQFYEHGLFKMLNELGIVDVNKSSYGGDWVGSGRVVPATDPAMCSKIVDVALPTRDEVDQCIQAAKDASQVWMGIQPPCRSVVLREIARRIREKRELLARLISLEVGKVLMDALCEVRGVVNMFEYAAGLASVLSGNIFESERPEHIILERFHPMGMVGVIASFNTPFSTFGKSASISLAVGNSVVFKPAPTTILSSMALMKIVSGVFKCFGLPPVVTLIQGDDNVGRAMAQDGRIEVIAFSGRAANGHDVGLRVQNRFGKSILNLYGNNAMIVNHDANLELALNAATLGIVDFAGQKKQKISHIIVHRHLYDRFVEELVKRIERVTQFCGHPLDPRSIFGPLHTKGITKAFTKAVQEIRENGGNIETGGEVIRGNFVQPAIVTNIHAKSEVMAFPIIGPIAFVTPAANIEEAIEINNGFSNRVNSSVFTKNVVDVFKYLSPDGLAGGVISINTANTGTELTVSLGGDRAAGGGRFSGSDIWKEYCRRVAVNINFSTRLPYAHGSCSIFGSDKFKLF